MKVLISWLGTTDLTKMKEGDAGALASIALYAKEQFDEIIILANKWEKDWTRYENWLKGELAKKQKPFNKVKIQKANIETPIDYFSITKVFQNLILNDVVPRFESSAINLSSGTGAMEVVSILIGKSINHCSFYQSSVESGVKLVELPYDFKANYQAATNERLRRITTADPFIESSFDRTVTHSEIMLSCVNRAKKLSKTILPALILGETGTGKERLCQSIHSESIKKQYPLKVINCGAIPENLVDSVLFGHKKGAFTGAVSDKKGLFELADKGTIFLDEVGELSAATQVKLLRVLEAKEILPVGADKPIKIDVRIIAATHCDLLQMVEQGKFREDLYYRIAVGVIELPPLRSRTEDIPILIDQLWSEINDAAGKHLDFSEKTLSQKIILFAQNQHWPGNVRELKNTLERALLWSEGKEVTLDDFENALQIRHSIKQKEQEVLTRGKKVKLSEIIDDVRRQYISKALEISGGSKVKACKMLDVKSHQVLTKHMEKLGLN